MSTERSSDVDSSISFSETVPEYPEEETERGKRDVITICNGADAIVYVELHPIQMVRRTKARKKNFGVGVDTAPLEGAVGVNMQVHMLNCKINGTVHIFFLKKSYLSPRCPKLPHFFSSGHFW